MKNLKSPQRKNHSIRLKGALEAQKRIETWFIKLLSDIKKLYNKYEIHLYTLDEFWQEVAFLIESELGALLVFLRPFHKFECKYPCPAHEEALYSIIDIESLVRDIKTSYKNDYIRSRR